MALPGKGEEDSPSVAGFEHRIGLWVEGREAKVEEAEGGHKK